MTRKPRETKPKEKGEGPKLGRPKKSRKKPDADDVSTSQPVTELSFAGGDTSITDDGSQSEQMGMSMSASNAEAACSTLVDTIPLGSGADDSTSLPEKAKKKTKPKTKAGVSRKRPSK